jgi:hypothetical protein
VMDDFGRRGRAYGETDVERAELEAICPQADRDREAAPFAATFPFVLKALPLAFRDAEMPYKMKKGSLMVVAARRRIHW